MIPSGVQRIIWAIAPSADLREAMLGDFCEEFEMRLQRHGMFRARAWCWREAFNSLGGALSRSVPRGNELLTSVLPGMVWGYVVAGCATLAMMTLFLPGLYRFVPVSHSAAWIAALGPVSALISLLAGYEAARVGRRSPLWSAVGLGLMQAAGNGWQLAIYPKGWPWSIFILLIPIACVAGAVLQQAQCHRLEPSDSAISKR